MKSCINSSLFPSELSSGIRGKAYGGIDENYIAPELVMKLGDGIQDSL